MKIAIFTIIALNLICMPVFAKEMGTKKFEVPKLNYNYNGLEPSIDEQTVKIHHDKHHQTYVDNLNKALENNKEYYDMSIEEVLKNASKLPSDVAKKVKNNGGGHYNHTFYWDIMTDKKGGNFEGNLKKAIERDFGSIEKFKEEFKNAALNTFGSGWAWLLKDDTGKLKIVSTQNQDTPIDLNLKPIIVIDVWEHAYYLKYQNRRAEYIDNFWNIINYEKAEELYNQK